MSTDWRQLAIGHYDMTCSEIPNIYSYWELRADGKAIQDGKEQGNWEIMEDAVVIKYYNQEHGHTVLTFDDENTLLGENLWRNGTLFTWSMKRVNP